MSQFNRSTRFVALYLSVLVYFQVQGANGSCEGSVTFYWKETSSGREGTMQKLGALENDKTIFKSTSQLEKVIDVHDTYAFRFDGNCC